jgi:RNA polymerase sigma-70 factor (ECF subfamily)
MRKNLEIEPFIDAPAETLADEVSALFHAYRAPLLRYLLSLGLTVPVGEEVVQEAFLSLFQHLCQGKPRENLRGWIFRVGHNLALKERLRTVRRPQVELDEQQRCLNPDPEESATLSQRHRRLLAVVRALPEQDQQCLHLRAEGLRYREIAQVLGVSLGSVAMMLSRSLLKVTKAEAL